MTKENAHEYLPFVQALAEGKDIEVLNPCTDEWEVIKDILFYEPSETYRVKPEKKLVPFTWEDRDLFRGKWVMHRYSTYEFILDIIDERYVSGVSYKELFADYMFLDGSTCGKEVEE